MPSAIPGDSGPATACPGDPEAVTVCPGCGAEFAASGPSDRFNASAGCWQAFSELSCYTVSKGDPEFLHQHAVDAYEAQHAGGRTKDITVVFGLAGLYLALEKGYTGREVQQAHMRMAKVRKDWPRLEPPARPAPVTVKDVLAVPEGPERDAVIRTWMAAVWVSWLDRQARVREITDRAMGWRE